MDDILSELGLTTLEVKIYKFLLYEGANLAGNISRKTGIHRRNVYDALERLIQKGLVSYIKENNQRVYEATSPETVESKLQHRLQSWQGLLPELHKIIALGGEKRETLFFRGINGIKHVFLDQISVGQEVLVFATNADVQRVVKYFFPKYQKMREEKGISTRMLLDAVSRNNKHAQTVKELPLCQAHFLLGFNSSNASQYVYGDNVAYVVWGDEPIAILIRHKEIAIAAREQFELLWRQAKP